MMGFAFDSFHQPEKDLRRIVLTPCEMIVQGLFDKAVQREVDRRNEFIKQKLRQTLGPKKARWR